MSWHPAFDPQAEALGGQHVPPVIQQMQQEYELLKERVFANRHDAPTNSNCPSRQTARSYDSKYLGLLCEYPLLTRQEEQLLGKLIEYHRALFQFSILNIESLREQMVTDLLRHAQWCKRLKDSQPSGSRTAGLRDDSIQYTPEQLIELGLPFYLYKRRYDELLKQHDSQSLESPEFLPA